MEPDPRLWRVIAVANSKGGIGKTSITANVSGQVAAGGYRVLAVDLDLSGNLGLDLGYVNDDRADEGLSVFNAIHLGSPLTVLPEVRPNLDVLPGGRRLEAVAALATLPRDEPGGLPGEFARRLAEVAGGYDVVMVDTAPGNPVLQDMALAAARYVVVPLRTDRAGMEGLLGLGPRVRKARETINPALTYLGAVMFGHNAQASRIARVAGANMEEVGDRVPLMEASIRHSEAVAQDARERGLLAHELAEQAEDAKKTRLQLLHRRADPDAAAALDDTVSPVAGSVAGDYTLLADEILRRVAAAEGTVDD